MKNTPLAILAVIIVFYLSFNSFRIITYISPIMNTAGVFFTPSITVSDLKYSYALAKEQKNRVKVLLVAGHEPDFGGTEYHGIKERDIAVDVVKEIERLLNKEETYDVTVSRDTKDWNPIFEAYFKENWNTIDSWKDTYKNEMVRLFKTGEVRQVTDGVVHNDAPLDVARRLYSINKWVNDKDIDIALHVHFNDNPRRYTNRPGEYSGFAIYVPEGQYSNANATQAVAQVIDQRLSQYFPISSMPKESQGVVEDQELVAIGRHNTVNAVSLLVEYAYIYEPWMHDKQVRDVLIKEMAYQTYVGIKSFFGESISKETTMLPYIWKHTFSSVDIAHLQFALMKEGLYPPDGKTKNDCPVTGFIGPCTQTAIDLFLKKYDIKKSGLAKKLNELFSSDNSI